MKEKTLICTLGIVLGVAEETRELMKATKEFNKPPTVLDSIQLRAQTSHKQKEAH